MTARLSIYLKDTTVEDLHPEWLPHADRGTIDVLLRIILAMVCAAFGALPMAMAGVISGKLIQLAYGEATAYPVTLLCMLGVAVGALLGLVAAVVYASKHLTGSLKPVTAIEISWSQLMAVPINAFIGVGGAGRRRDEESGLRADEIGRAIEMELEEALATSDIPVRSRPQEGMHRSLRTVFTVWLCSIIWTFPIQALSACVFFLMCIWLRGAGLGMGVFVGILAVRTALIPIHLALKKGGMFCLQHYVIRAMLFYRDLMPRHITGFLDQAVERGLLRRVGGRYIFLHRLLEEYFASLYERSRDT